MLKNPLYTLSYFSEESNCLRYKLIYVSGVMLKFAEKFANQYVYRQLSLMFINSKWFYFYIDCQEKNLFMKSNYTITNPIFVIQTYL